MPSGRVRSVPVPLPAAAPGCFAAPRTQDILTLIFGNVRLDLRQFGDLMPPWRTGSFQRFGSGQITCAVTALRRIDLHDIINALRWNLRPPMSAMAGLTARLASAFFPAAAFALLARKPIRRRRFGRCRRVLLPQSQLTFQIRDLLFRFRQFLLAVGQFLAQAIIVAPQPLVLALRLPPVFS